MRPKYCPVCRSENLAVNLAAVDFPESQTDALIAYDVTCRDCGFNGVNAPAEQVAPEGE